MIRKTFSDRDEIIKLRKEVNELENQIRVLPKTTTVEDLTDREKRILKYLKKNPGVSKDAVVKTLTIENKGSRVTVFKAIKNLIDYSMISARKDKENSPVYKLYLNEDSVFLSVYQELEEFKDVFFDLIEKLRTKKPRLDVASNGNDVLYDLLLIYQHVLGVFLTYSFLKWPAIINDKSILNKIYVIILYRMIEIQTKLSLSFKLHTEMPIFDSGPTCGQAYSPLFQQFISHTFLLKPQYMMRILEDYRKSKMHQDIIPLLKIVWKIGFPIYRFTILDIDLLSQHINVLKDWRYAISYYLYRNKDNIHVDKEIWDMLGSPPTID